MCPAGVRHIRKHKTKLLLGYTLPTLERRAELKLSSSFNKSQFDTTDRHRVCSLGT
jgi:hypothetical protein